MKIGIDIDDTLTNTKDVQKKYWKIYYNLNPNDKYTEELPDIINNFDVDEYTNIFWDTYRQELTFSPTFKNDCSNVIRKLNDDGYTLCIITSRPDSKYKDLHGSLKEWFKDNNIAIDIIYTNVRNKGEFLADNGIDLIIDDDIRHCNKALEVGKKAILFNHNDSYNGPQTTDWLEVYDIIKSTL